MKKLSILLLAVLYIGVANVSAQTEVTNETVTAVEEVTETKICSKTGKICKKTCKNKAKGTCCQSKKGKSSCSKSKKGSFNFNNSNNYGGTSSCSKAKKKAKKCGEDCTKPCCATEEVAADEEVAPTDE